MSITADDVVELVTVLQSAGVRVWLAEGWGVDALLGEQTRPHVDLDLAVPTDDLAGLRRALAEHGFTVLRVDGAFYAVLIDDRAGRWIATS